MRARIGSRHISAVLAALVVLLPSIRGQAIEQRPLPAFQVLSLDGTTVDSAQLSAVERWLLIYVTPECSPCDRLLQALKAWRTPQLVERIVLIVGADAVPARAWVQDQLPAEISGVAWFADERGEAVQALRLQGAPVLLGIRQGRIEWEISGVLNDPNALASVVQTWVEY